MMLVKSPAPVVPLPPALHPAGSGTLVKKQGRKSDVLETRKDGSRHTPPGPRDVFICSEESHFYSQCLDKFMLKNTSSSCETVMEFGTGDGSPVIGCLSGRRFDGVVHGFEINTEAAALARSTAARHGLGEKYQIHSSCFFKAAKAKSMGASTLIANPPYIPAPDNRILMPALHGGTDGAQLTRDLMQLGFDNLILMISSYSNPVHTLQHARAQGYCLTDWLVTPLPFGTYSSEPKVRKWIAKMRQEGLAFYSEDCYLLAGVLLQKSRHKQLGSAPTDMTDGLLSVLTAL